MTYPKGHKKAGEPLDKICIIGQSGTGKTNLLGIIRDKLYKNSVKVEIIKDENSDSEEIYVKGINNITLQNKNDNPEDKEFIDYMQISREKIKRALLNLFPMIILLIVIFIYFSINPENIIIPFFRYIPLLLLGFIFVLILWVYIKGVWNNLLQNKSEVIKNYINRIAYIELDESAWYILKKRIDNYSTERKEYKDRKSEQLLNLNNYEKKDFLEDMDRWEDKNINILNEISKKLNTILIKFNIELIRIDQNSKQYNDLIFEDLSNNKIIKYDDLSTGTKNIISTFIPLKIHNPKDSIILIDEPENSFYPDIQRMLTDLYMEIGENNQIIFATHSPLIASSFEPWEIVELKFDEDNQVYRELYFEGDRHVDNYTLDPQLLTWTGILMDIFDMKESSNSNLREQKLIEFNILKEEIKNIKNLEEKEKLFKKLQNMGKKLGIYNQ